MFDRLLGTTIAELTGLEFGEDFQSAYRPFFEFLEGDVAGWGEGVEV